MTPDMRIFDERDVTMAETRLPTMMTDVTCEGYVKRNDQEPKFMKKNLVIVKRDIKIFQGQGSSGLIGKCWECDIKWNKAMDKYVGKTYMIGERVKGKDTEMYHLVDTKTGERLYPLPREVENGNVYGWFFCRHWLLGVENNIKATVTVKGDRLKYLTLEGDK